MARISIEMYALAEDVLIELNDPWWNDKTRQRSMVNWLLTHDYDEDGSVCEAADEYRIHHTTLPKQGSKYV